MNRFQTPLDFRTLIGVDLGDKPFQLISKHVYRTSVLKDILYIESPVGFRSDMLTIPRIARRIFSVICWARDAAIPHDFCCDPVDENLNPIPHFCSHDEAADVFAEALEEIITVADWPKKKKKRRRKQAAVMVWCVRHCGPKFNRPAASSD